jgi:hypothetical protein
VDAVSISCTEKSATDMAQGKKNMLTQLEQNIRPKK